MENTTDVICEATEELAKELELDSLSDPSPESVLPAPRNAFDEWTEAEWFRVWLRLAHGEDPNSPDHANS